MAKRKPRFYIVYDSRAINGTDDACVEETLGISRASVDRILEECSSLWGNRGACLYSYREERQNIDNEGQDVLVDERFEGVIE